MMPNLTPLALRILGSALVLLLVVAVLFLGPAACNKIRSMGAQHRMDTEQSGAFRNSAVEAINTQGAVNDRATQSEAVGRANAEDIRHAQGAANPVTPASRDAAFASLCLRRAFRLDPANRLRCPDPEGVAKPGAGARVRG